MPAVSGAAWLSLAEALAAVARATLPAAWRRYCALAATRYPDTASPEDAGLRRLRQPRGEKYWEAWGDWQGFGRTETPSAEAARLEREFAAVLIAELAAGRWRSGAASSRDSKWHEPEPGVWGIDIDLDPATGNVAIPGAPALRGLRLRPVSPASPARSPSSRPEQSVVDVWMVARAEAEFVAQAGRRLKQSRELWRDCMAETGCTWDKAIQAHRHLPAKYRYGRGRTR